MPKMRTDDGVELSYRVDDFRDPWAVDSGDTILMAHGFGRTMKWWTQWVPALSRKYRVVRYDGRGCGESSVPPQGATWSAERLCMDALDLLDHLGIEKVHWVGFESGGTWGMGFAASYPDRIRSLTLCSTPYFSGQRRGPTRASEVMQEVGFSQWLADTYSARMDLSLADPKLVDWHLAEHSKTPTEVAVAITRVAEDLDVSQWLPKIKVPTLMMVGDRCAPCPLDAQSSMQKQIPSARLVVFPNIGPGIHLLIPDLCVRELLAFLKEV